MIVEMITNPSNLIALVSIYYGHWAQNTYTTGGMYYVS